ncbi:MAG: hypothetical protein LKE40_04275 [Spirochaetia bacterium]|nr:hypothetical protein [Spirochaetia bacterium]
MCLYNSTNASGTFTAPLKQFAYAGALYGDSTAYFLGFPYGPGAFLTQAIITYENKTLKTKAMLGILLKDEASVDEPYSSSSTMSEFSLADSDLHILLSGKGELKFTEAVTATGLLHEDLNLNDSTSDFTASLGITIHLFQAAKQYLETGIGK